MSSKQENVDYIASQMAGASSIRSRKMFGEHAIYCNEVVIALVCDDQLYLKPTESGRVLLGEPELAPPYPGAKNYFVVPKERWADAELLSQLALSTLAALPKKKA